MYWKIVECNNENEKFRVKTVLFELKPLETNFNFHKIIRYTWFFTQTLFYWNYQVHYTCMLWLQDKAKNIQLTVLTDRSQGGGSVKDGEIEIMVSWLQ